MATNTKSTGLPTYTSFDALCTAFAATAGVDIAASTSSVDRLRMVIDGAMPHGDKPPLIATEKQVEALYAALVAERKRKLGATFREPDGKSLRNQVIKYAKALPFAKAAGKDALRVFDTAKALIVDGVADDGSHNVVTMTATGGRVFNRLLSLMSAQAELAGKPLTNKGVAEFLEGQDTEAEERSKARENDPKVPLQRAERAIAACIAVDGLLSKADKEAFTAFHDKLTGMVKRLADAEKVSKAVKNGKQTGGKAPPPAAKARAPRATA